MLLGVVYKATGYVTLRGKNEEAYVKKEKMCTFRKGFPLIKSNIGI